MTRLGIVSSIAATLTAACFPAGAQRADACEIRVGERVDGARERLLRSARYSLTEASLASAMSDADPSVRSLAADELGSRKEKKLIPLSMHAWSSERDGCTRDQLSSPCSRLCRIRT